jgi:mono/diheme cytochrome c family protein
MKKCFVIAGMMVLATLLYNCSGSKKATASAPPPPVASNYETNVKTVIEANCSPCHIPAKGGNKKAYDNFANVKTDIDDIIRRIELNPTDRGFMPFKHPKLSDSTIAVFKKWKTDGTLEK